MNIDIKTLLLPDRTLGIGEYEDFSFCTLELPWRFNQKNKSCIPSGTYECVKIKDHYRFGKCIYIPDVPDRSEIFVHVGNFTRDIQGCILVGNGIRDIDRDDKFDVSGSTATMQRLWAMLPELFTITIRRH